VRVIPDEERNRLLRENPHLRASYKDYCPTCDKAGSYMWRGERYNCDCERQLALHMRYLLAGIGTTYQRLDWTDFTGDDKLVESIKRYGEKHRDYVRRGMGLIFTGEYGTGKTMLANLILKEFVKFGYTCFATTFANTIEMFTAGWKAASEQRRFQDKFVGSEVLLLDDLGRERRNSTNLSETTFDSILRTRTQYGRPTFITTNLTFDELGEGYGGAVLSLLRENSILLTVGGKDFRPTANTRTREEINKGEMRPIS